MKRVKKFLWAILSVCCICLCLGFASLDLFKSSASGTELVKDGTFTSGNLNSWTKGWKGNNDKAIHAVSDGALSITNGTEAPNSHVAQDVTLTEGKMYTLSFKMKTENVEVSSTGGGIGAYALIYPADASDAVSGSLARLGYFYSGATTVSLNTDWETFSAKFTATATKTYRISIRLWSATGTMYADDVSLTEEGDSTIADGTFANGNLNSWTHGWNGNDNTAKYTVATDTHTADGSGSLKATNTSGASSSYIGTDVYLIKDAKYKVSGYIKLASDFKITTANDNGGAYLSFDPSYNVWRGLTGDNKTVIPNAWYDWTYCEMYFTPTESCVHTIRCTIWGATGTAYFDDISIEMVEEIDSEVLKHWSTTASYPTDFTGDAFTLIGIGDTQMCVSYYPDRISEMYQWMVDNKTKYNIQYAMHLGDIVDVPTDANQWKLMQAGHQLLQDAGIKYSLSPGNHDYEGLIGLTNGTYVERSLEAYNTYFPASNFTSWLGTENFGLYQEGKMDNTWHKFTYGGHKYLIVALEYGPNDDVLAWANQVVASNSDHHVIVTTHAFLNGDTAFDTDTQTHLADANSPQQIWDKFAKLHSNIFMIVSGHYVSYGVNTMVSYGVNGNPVIQMKVDPQNIMGNGETFITLYRISNGTDVQTYYYSVYSGKYYAGSNFSLAPVQGVAGTNAGVVEMNIGETADLLGFVSLDEVTPKCTYTSTNTDVATVDENGIVHAIGLGETTITYALDGKRSAYATKGVETKYTVTLRVVGEIALNFKACNLALRDNIHLQYAVSATGVTNDKVKVLVWTTPQTTYKYGTQDAVLSYDPNNVMEIDGTTYPVYAYTGLSIKEMTDVVYACVYVDVGGQGYYSTPFKYSILEYAYNKLGYTDKTATTDTNLKTLLNDLLKLGASMQTYLGYNTDSLPTDDFTYVSMENASFEDGFSYGLYKAGTEVKVIPADNYTLSQTAGSYFKVNGEDVIFTIPEEMTIDTDSFVYAYESPVTANEANVLLTTETTYSYTKDNVVKAVENVNENYVALTMSYTADQNSYVAGINLTGSSTGWNGGLVLAWKETGFSIRVGGVNKSVLIPLNVDTSIPNGDEITIVYKLTYVESNGSCTHVQLDVWYGLAGSYVKVGIVDGNASSGDKWSYDTATGTFTFDCSIVDEAMFASDCTLLFMGDNNRFNSSATEWTVHSISVSATKFAELGDL